MFPWPAAFVRTRFTLGCHGARLSGLPQEMATKIERIVTVLELVGGASGGDTAARRRLIGGGREDRTLAASKTLGSTAAPEALWCHYLGTTVAHVTLHVAYSSLPPRLSGRPTFIDRFGSYAYTGIAAASVRPTRRRKAGTSKKKE